MSAAGAKGKPVEQNAHPAIRTKIYVRDDMIGGGKMELLRFVHLRGSISAAGLAMGMNDRRAGFLLDTLQACFSSPLLAEKTEASAGADVELTPFGLDLLNRFEAHQQALADVSADFLGWLEENQATE